jgi:hypothetical protein
MNSKASYFIQRVGDKIYHLVRCWTSEPYPWHQCVKYFPQEPTNKEVQQLLKEFMGELT